MIFRGCLLLLACLSSVSFADSKLSSLMPKPEDYTQMWWAEGFPTRVPNAPWRRCIQTGNYAFVLDTETLRVPHFGAVPPGTDYADSTRSEVWRALPAAELGLQITVDGKNFRASAGGKWTQRTGPRLIESGRFLQRADVTNLEFKADDGSVLAADARFETVAWPDRLGLILAARPGLQPIPKGEDSFGRVGGGFGFDGTNHFEIPPRPEFDAAQFTLELWAFVPTDYVASPPHLSLARLL